jgi:hypothetical protein
MNKTQPGQAIVIERKTAKAPNMPIKEPKMSVFIILLFCMYTNFSSYLKTPVVKSMVVVVKNVLAVWTQSNIFTRYRFVLISFSPAFFPLLVVRTLVKFRLFWFSA